MKYIQYKYTQLEQASTYLIGQSSQSSLALHQQHPIHALDNSMANPNSLPLHEKILLKNTIQRAVDLTILLLLLSLLVYRSTSLNNHGITWLVALACESWFTFIWVLLVSTRWNPIEYKTYPERILQRVHDLPPVDMFVTTADPELEPPIITVNTVLSLLAVDYPANKLACYVSDDGCSPLTFYSLTEALKFAKLWVPFCKKYGVHVRAPFRYFSGEPPEYSGEYSLKFQQEWKEMKDEYDQLSQKIEAVQNSAPYDLTTSDFTAFSNIKRKNHPTIIKVVWENKGGLSHELPHLIYVSREKHPKQTHHYKAGAMNVLTRISGVMTNAPFLLNVDCDMFVNNPQIVLHAMCSLLGVKEEREIAFVQCPQIFYDGLKDDPFGNQMVVLARFVNGMAGIQGPPYMGTGCFHRRKIIYGLSPDVTEIKGLEKIFGKSVEFTKSVAQILTGLNDKTDSPHDLLSSLKAAYLVAGCGYESGSSWGTQVGWLYGSIVEDSLTGMKIQARGWNSVYSTPNPPAFLGCAPTSGLSTLTQQKRWAIGFSEIFFSVNNPFFLTLTRKFQFRQSLAYLWCHLWGLRSIPELCYAVLPAYCIVTNCSFLPKVQEPAMLIPVAIFLIYNLYTLSEYLQAGLSIRAWWNNQRMERINSTSAWLFGILSVILKLIGLTKIAFEVTQKEQTRNGDGATIDAGRFTFDESPIFIPGTTVLLMHLYALLIGLLGFKLPNNGGDDGTGMGEILCSVWVVLMFSPFVKGLFGKGKYGSPTSIICKSVALALALSLLFVCIRASMY